MSLPTEDLSWATAGTIVDPGGAQKATGWIYKQKVPFGWLNFLFNGYYKFIDYFKLDISTGRDPAYGYQYSSGKPVRWLLSPVSAPYLDIGVQAITIDVSGNPPFARATTAGATTAIAKIPLTHFMQFAPSDSPTTPSLVITNLRMLAKKGAVGGQIIVTLKAYFPFSSGAVTTVHTWTPTLGTSFTDEDEDVAIDVFGSTKAYWFEIEIGTAGVNTDTGVQGFTVEVEKNCVEGAPNPFTL